MTHFSSFSKSSCSWGSGQQPWSHFPSKHLYFEVKQSTYNIGFRLTQQLVYSSFGLELKVVVGRKSWKQCYFWTEAIQYKYHNYSANQKILNNPFTFAKVDTEWTFLLSFSILSVKSATESPTDQDLWPFPFRISIALHKPQKGEKTMFRFSLFKLLLFLVYTWNPTDI